MSTTPLAPALLRLHPAQPLGAAWLVAPYRALTCAHCVRGLNVVDVDWPLLPTQPRCLAHVMEVDPQADVAVLALNDAPPQTAPAPLAQTWAVGHPFSAFGFPSGHPQGVWATGQFAGPNAFGWVQLEGTRPTGKRIDLGFSGGPVWDGATGAVVGMVVASDVDPPTQVGFMLPLARLVAYLDVVPSSQRSDSPNPFHAGGAVPPEKFVGRAATLALVRHRLGGPTLQSLSIVGDRRIGKSSLLTYIAARAPQLWPTQTPIVIYLDLQRAYCHTRAGFMQALRRALSAARPSAAPPLALWPAAADGDLAALAFALDDLAERGLRLVLALDEVEELTKRRAEFDDLLEELRGAGQAGKLALLTASARPLADLCAHGGLSSPFYNIFVQETLGLLTPPEGQALLHAGLPNLAPAQAAALEQIAGQHPHPFYLALAASRLWLAQGYNPWLPNALADCHPHWQHLWQHLTPPQQALLRRLAASHPERAQDTERVEGPLLHHLRQRGLLHPTALRVFSAAFSEWVQANS